MAILIEMYDKFREEYFAEFPGSNENEVEQSFICCAYDGIDCGDSYMSAELIAKIKSIV